MKATGIVRRVDTLGRVVIPKELRTTFKIKEGDSMEIFVEQDMIVFQKYQQGCIFCKNVDNMITFNGRYICKECAAKIAINGPQSVL